MAPAGEVVGKENALVSTLAAFLVAAALALAVLPMDIPCMPDEELVDADELGDADATPAVVPASAATPRSEIKATGTAPTVTHTSRPRTPGAATETGTNSTSAAANSSVVVVRPTGSAVSHPVRRYRA